MHFIASLSVVKKEIISDTGVRTTNIKIEHFPLLITDVASKEEAVGIGYRELEKAFPTSDGWTTRHVSVREISLSSLKLS